MSGRVHFPTAESAPFTVRQLLWQKGEAPQPRSKKVNRKRRKPSRSETGPPTPGRCADCEWTGTQRQHERHHQETGHGVWEVTLR